MPVPKKYSGGVYTFYSITSSQIISWLTTQKDYAVSYDRNNVHRITNTIPDYIRYD